MNFLRFFKLRTFCAQLVLEKKQQQQQLQLMVRSPKTSTVNPSFISTAPQELHYKINSY